MIREVEDGQELIEVNAVVGAERVRFVRVGVPPRNGGPTRLRVVTAAGVERWASPLELHAGQCPDEWLALLGFWARLVGVANRWWASLEMDPVARVLPDCGHKHPRRRLATACALARGANTAVIRWARELEHFSDADTALWLLQAGEEKLSRLWNAQRVAEVDEQQVRFRDGSTVGEREAIPWQSGQSKITSTSDQ